MTDPLRRACKAVIASAHPGGISRFISPEGDVVVVARAKEKDAKTIAAVFAQDHNEDHDVASCLYAWYEEHKP